MGFSLTGAHVIFFVAAVIAAGAVSGIFIAITTNISTSLSNTGNRVAQTLDTDYAIINDPAAIPHNASTYTFYLKNIGARKLDTTNTTFTLFLDGNIIDKQFYTFQDPTLSPEDVTSLNLTTTLTSGDHTLRLVGPLATETHFQFQT